VTKPNLTEPPLLLLLIIWAWEEDKEDIIATTVITNIKIKAIVPEAIFCCMSFVFLLICICYVLE
jgi:hypothetical protein